MKPLLLIGICVAAAPALADEYVNGYIRRDGTYVEPHYRSSPNQNRYDNYSSQGNTNPYTGQRGYERHEFSTPAPVYVPNPLPELPQPGYYRTPRY